MTQDIEGPGFTWPSIPTLLAGGKEVGGGGIAIAAWEREREGVPSLSRGHILSSCHTHTETNQTHKPCCHNFTSLVFPHP